MSSDVRKSGGETADGPRGRPQGEASEARARRKIKQVQDELAFGGPAEQLEWDSIRKLDYPPPRWWVLTFWGTFLFAALWWLSIPPGRCLRPISRVFWATISARSSRT